MYEQLREFFIYMADESMDNAVLTTPTYDRDEISKNLTKIEYTIFVYH